MNLRLGIVLVCRLVLVDLLVRSILRSGLCGVIDVRDVGAYLDT
jgi:hypothetical protein